MNVLSFIRLKFPDRYCAPCLALALKEPPEEIGRLLDILIDKGFVLVGRRQCDKCERNLDVFAPEPSQMGRSA
jgi:hypothetical protein